MTTNTKYEDAIMNRFFSFTQSFIGSIIYSKSTRSSIIFIEDIKKNGKFYSENGEFIDKHYINYDFLEDYIDGFD